jgi:hypothetical protein
MSLSLGDRVTSVAPSMPSLTQKMMSRAKIAASINQRTQLLAQWVTSKARGLKLVAQRVTLCAQKVTILAECGDLMKCLYGVKNKLAHLFVKCVSLVQLNKLKV